MLVLFGVVASLTLLITSSTISRFTLHMWVSGNVWALELVECPMCIGFWITLAVFAVAGAPWEYAPLVYLATVMTLAAYSCMGRIGQP